MTPSHAIKKGRRYRDYVSRKDEQESCRPVNRPVRPRDRALRRGLVPLGMVMLVGVSQAFAEISPVIVELKVMNLEPNARDVDRVAMGRKPPVSVIYIRADVLHTVDHT